MLELLRSLGITLRDSSLGLIFDVKLDPAGYNIAFTSEEVPPHNDNAQYTHPPSGQVLAMLVNDAKGGDSVVVDGWSVLDHLQRDHPEAIDVLARVEVGFRQYSTEADAFTRAPLVVRDRAGRFVHLRFSNQLMQPLAFDDSDLADWYRAYRCWARRSPIRPTMCRSASRPATPCSSTATACCTPARRTNPMGLATCKTCTSTSTTSSAIWRA